MPNSAAAATLLVRATKWRATSWPPLALNQASAERALTIVSKVVKLLDATTKSVVSGFKGASTAVNSWPSTFDTKWKRLPGITKSCKATTAICGPRSEPPMPMFTTSVICASALMVSAKANIGFKVACTCASGSAKSPPKEPSGWRSSQCITARSSVVLMGSPRNIASRCAAKPV